MYLKSLIDVVPSTTQQWCVALLAAGSSIVPAATVLVTVAASASQYTARMLSTVVAAGIVVPAGMKISGRSPLATNRPPFVVVALVVTATTRRSSIT